MYTAITVSASNDLKRSYIIAVSSLKLDDNLITTVNVA